MRRVIARTVTAIVTGSLAATLVSAQAGAAPTFRTASAADDTTPPVVDAVTFSPTTPTVVVRASNRYGSDVEKARLRIVR